ncbi:SDR family NAD(P)-dependent oxidoreductase [Amycolatopsis sp. NPDC058986]|uniref:SDR family NAD(P)-dependent oxidoreductase n=1 Tax=unclassified Amycolatopsis TaxID=2618356 RepID=UPI003670C4A2
MKTVAIFGAGPGAGFATARRFGREGFRVALVARSGERVAAFAKELAGEGIEAEAFTADLGDLDTHTRVVDAVTERFGGIDVAVINGFLPYEAIRPILDLDVEAMRDVLRGTVLAPMSLTRLILPGLREKGDGALLYGLGLSAKTPAPPLAAPGSGQAGLRNYIHNLHTVLAPEGVYAGALTIGKLVQGSDAQALFDRSVEARHGFDPERVEPEELAERYWELYTRRERAEITVGELVA